MSAADAFAWSMTSAISSSVARRREIEPFDAEPPG
jgi:hypothetical protein